jgi:hypothetical protein
LVFDMQRTISSVKLFIDGSVAFDLLRLRQHVVIAPPGIAQLPPAVVVAAIAANVDQIVEDARTPAGRPRA